MIELDIHDNDSEKYEMEVIQNSVIYAKESELAYLSGFYYLVSYKKYPEEENIWKPASAVQHFKKLISSFYKDYPNKPTATSPAINTALPMTRPTVKLTANKK